MQTMQCIVDRSAPTSYFLIGRSDFGQRQLRFAIKIAMIQALLRQLSIVHYNRRIFGDVESNDVGFVVLAQRLHGLMQMIVVEQQHEQIAAEEWNPRRSCSGRRESVDLSRFSDQR